MLDTPATNSRPSTISWRARNVAVNHALNLMSNSAMTVTPAITIAADQFDGASDHSDVT